MPRSLAGSPLLAGTSIPSLPPNPTNKRLRGAVIEVQGLNAVIEHWFATAQLTLELTPGVLDFYSDVGVHNARQFVRKRTWATHDSINKDPGVQQISHGNFWVEWGASTFYSKFLEWGTVNMPPYPFIVPSIDSVERDFINAFNQIAKIPDQFANQVRLSGDVGKDPRTRGPIQRLRGSLYSTSKFLGDIAVFGGRQFISPVRSFAIDTAKLLGDVDAAMRGAIGARVSHRLRGRATGRLQGFGSASLTHAQTYTGFAGGAGGHRIYNRFVGRIAAPTVSTNFPRLG